jgi:hypothetical protein
MGIIGLKQILAEVVQDYSGRPNDEIEAELLNRLSKLNYIPHQTRTEYGRAFLREFKKYTGRPPEAEEAGGLEVKVLGPGCPRCNQMEQDLMSVMTELKLIGDIEHVTDIVEIGEYGVMGTPALVINGEVKSVGSVPPKGKLKVWLQEAAIQQ